MRTLLLLALVAGISVWVCPWLLRGGGGVGHRLRQATASTVAVELEAGHGARADGGSAPESDAPQEAEAEEAATEPSSAEFLQYTDSAGRVHFVDSPDRIPVHARAAARPIKPQQNRLVLQPRTPTPAARERSARSAATAARSPAHAVLEAAPDRAQVVVYSAPWCGWCRKTLAWLEAEQIAFTNKDIEAHPEFREELIRKTGRTSIPWIEVGDVEIPGFDPERILEALAR